MFGNLFSVPHTKRVVWQRAVWSWPQTTNQASESEDSTSSGSEGKEGWSKQDWDAYLAKLEREVKEGRAPMDLRIRGWEIYVCFPVKLKLGFQTAVRAREDSEGEALQDRLPNQEGPEFEDFSPFRWESQVVSIPRTKWGLAWRQGVPHRPLSTNQ